MKKYFTIVCSFAALLLIAGLISCGDDESGSSLTGLVSYGLKDYSVNFNIDEGALTISNTGADSLPFGTDVSALVAEFDAIDLTTVTVNSVDQVSGVTANNFSSPVTYKVVAEDGITEKNYVVTVNVSQIDPETVSWNRIANEEWNAFEITRAASFDGKLWVYGYVAGVGSFGVDIVEAYSSSDGGVTWMLEDAKDDQYNYSTEETGFPFPNGRSISLVKYDGKLWSIGGFMKGRPTENGTTFDDATNNVWSTDDGVNWERDSTMGVPNAGEEGEDLPTFSIREAVSALTFDDKMWIIGGNGQGLFGAVGTPLNDVWNSPDGIVWTEVTGEADFMARTAPASIVFDGKMWIIGGVDSEGTLLNDVWSSTDGMNWTEENATAEFEPRKAAGVFAFNDKLFLVGGEGADGEQYGDMWVSEDGATWTAVDSSDPFALPASFTGRSNHAVFVEGNEIFIIGGKGPLDGDALPTYYSSVWRGVGVE